MTDVEICGVELGRLNEALSRVPSGVMGISCLSAHDKFGLNSRFE